MATLLQDIDEAATLIANALSSSGYRADFSVESFRDIDRFFDEHSRDGEVVPDGLLAERFGQRMFAIGSYVGETIRRVRGGEWLCDDSDPDGEINVAIRFPNGAVIWPIQRVMKRFKNGAEDGIYVYGVLATGGGIPVLLPTKTTEIASGISTSSTMTSNRPWWRFW